MRSRCFRHWEPSLVPCSFGSPKLGTGWPSRRGGHPDVVAIPALHLEGQIWSLGFALLQRVVAWAQQGCAGAVQKARTGFCVLCVPAGWSGARGTELCCGHTGGSLSSAAGTGGASGEDMGTRDVRVHGGRGWEVMPMWVVGVRGLVLGAGSAWGRSDCCGGRIGGKKICIFGCCKSKKIQRRREAFHSRFSLKIESPADFWLLPPSAP